MSRRAFWLVTRYRTAGSMAPPAQALSAVVAGQQGLGWAVGGRGQSLVVTVGPVEASSLDEALSQLRALEEALEPSSTGAEGRTRGVRIDPGPQHAATLVERGVEGAVSRMLSLAVGPQASASGVEVEGSSVTVWLSVDGDEALARALGAAGGVCAELWRAVDPVTEVEPVKIEVKPAPIDDEAPVSMRTRSTLSNVRLAIVPFRPGRRPVDEGFHPGTGASENCGLLTGKRDDDDSLWLLYELHGAIPDRLLAKTDVRMTAWFLPTDEGEAPVLVPSMQGVSVPAQVVAASSVPALGPASFAQPRPRRYVAALRPGDLLPGEGTYSWDAIAASMRKRTPDGQDAFTFCHQFQQKVRVELALYVAGERLSAQTIDVQIFDVRRFGSLYQRLLERLVAADTRQQAMAQSAPDLHRGYHPWYPVLAIGTNKADRYMAAIQQDIVLQQHFLPDPAWLLRVGLYLELLTCLGIIEVVKTEYPSLLSPEERRFFEDDPSFAEVRRRINPPAWAEVWKLRHIVTRKTSVLSTGAVDVTNLLRKQAATLGFLHAHHADLKHAIELAGPNLTDSQETWHRVFRDAERAVLSMSLSAFPELQYLPQWQRDFALWHQRGDMKVLGRAVLPDWLTGIFGDQDGVYPSACRQYRDSMNEVAAWARQRHLMDYTGEQCVPKTASLIEAHLERSDRRLSALQARDGYGPTLDVGAGPTPKVRASSADEIEGKLRRVSILSPLLDEECRQLATTARLVHFGPHDRVVLQGQEGSSLFVVHQGTLDVVFRQPDGTDVRIAELHPGDVFGELALLTGKPRTATVQSVEEVTLVEISRDDLLPILDKRRALVDELSMLLASRQAQLQSATDRAQKGTDDEQGLFARLITGFFFGAAQQAAQAAQLPPAGLATKQRGLLRGMSRCP